MPSARRVARELGIDLGGVSGSGRNGIVRRADVEAFAQGAAPAAAGRCRPGRGRSGHGRRAARPGRGARALAGEGETRVPLRGVRRKIAEAMVRSKYTAPHFTVVEELDVTELVRVRDGRQGAGGRAGHQADLHALHHEGRGAAALAKYPSLNSKLDEAAQEIVTYPVRATWASPPTPRRA